MTQTTNDLTDERQLAAVLELYKLVQLKPEKGIEDALKAHFLEGKSLREAGELCGKSKQGMAYHVKRVHELHASLLASLQHLKGTK